MKNIKLTIEMIPTTNFYNNIRSTLSNSQWTKIRKDCYTKADNKCEICGETGKKQGYKHNVECHEVWSYDKKTKTQKLIRLISLCVRCHLCKHIGRAISMGKQAEVFKHMYDVNKWSHKELLDYLVIIFKEYKETSKIAWKLDLTKLTEDFGINKKLLSQTKVVKTKTPFWKKKKAIKKPPKKK